MMKRRNVFGLAALGPASALLSLPVPHAQTARPQLEPFRDELPLPPPPREFSWNPGGPLPFTNLDPEAATYVDRTQAAGKAGFFRLRTEVRKVKLHAQLPETEIWGYADDHPRVKSWPYALGPTFKRFLAGTNRFAGTIVRHVNHLPADADHRGFGEPFTTAHLHGAHVPYRFDGFPTELEHPDGTRFNPVSARGDAFDYAYPLMDPGFSTGVVEMERPSTLWYHDHFLDFTAPNVYRGLIGLFLTFDGLDSGNESTGLRLPSEPYDIPLVLHEKTFDLNGQLVYDVFNTDGFLGREYLVNGMVRPKLHVKRRKYRFRILNGSNARIYQLFLCDKSGRSYPMTQIATEGGLLARPVRNRPSVILGMAERVEVVVDFNLPEFRHPHVTELFIENRLVQHDGRGPEGKSDDPELARRGTQILKFVLEEQVTDTSQVPDVLRPFAPIPAATLAAARVRRFEFDRTNGQWAINNRLAGELKRVEATPRLGVGEVWRLVNDSGGWWHPIHVHHEFMRVIRRNGRLPFDGSGRDFGQPVERDGLARKDTVLLGPNDEVDVYVKFQDFKGPYVFHCHNLEHEDHQMMGRFDVI